MVAPVSSLVRTETVTLANPTPPTNVFVTYQGSPPTPQGLAPIPTVAADIDTTNPWLLADPRNGAVKPPDAPASTFPPTTVAVTDLAGKAEAEGTEVTVTVASGRVTGHSVFGNYSEAPNSSHPSMTGVPPVDLPVNTITPVITGLPQVGQVLSVVPGVWTGGTPMDIVWEWYTEAGVRIATGPTFLVTTGQVGQKLKVLELADNMTGTVGVYSSLTVAVIP